MTRFVWSHCGATCVAERSREEVEAEYAKAFPGDPISDAVDVCEDCYKDLMALARDLTDKLANMGGTIQ